MDITFDGTVIQQYLTTYGIKLVGALALFIIGKWVVKAGVGIIKNVMKKSNLDSTLISFIGNIVYALGLTFVVIAALGHLGIETTSLAAAIAAAGLAIGLALQNSLSNFAAGVMLILFKPFKTGDFVIAGGSTGVVQDVTVFTTELKTPDNQKVIVPNGAITSGNITNVTAHPTRRIDLTVGVGYNDDLKKVKAVLHRIVENDSRILKDPAVTIAVSELADSSVNLVVRPWVKTSDYWAVYFDLTEAIKTTFDEEGISIPFPQQDIHVVDMKMTEKACVN